MLACVWGMQRRARATHWIAPLFEGACRIAVQVQVNCRNYCAQTGACPRKTALSKGRIQPSSSSSSHPERQQLCRHGSALQAALTLSASANNFGQQQQHWLTGQQTCTRRNSWVHSIGSARINETSRLLHSKHWHDTYRNDHGINRMPICRRPNTCQRGLIFQTFLRNHVLIGEAIIHVI